MACARQTRDNQAMRAPSLAFVVASVAAAVGAPAPASAGVLKLFGQADGGGIYGKGTSGDLKDKAFFAKAPHGMYGASVGVEFLFLDAWIQHHQFFNGSRLATWTQFGLGVHAEIDAGSSPAERKAGKGPYVDFGAGAFFGIGTGQQVMPPLSNDEVTDKGFLLQGSVGFGKHLSSVFDVGLAVPVSYGYFFKNGGGAVANDLSTHYRSVQVEGMIYLRANIRLL